MLARRDIFIAIFRRAVFRFVRRFVFAVVFVHVAIVFARERARRLHARAFLRFQANWWQVIFRDRLDAMDPALRLRLGLTWPNRGYGSYLVSTNPQPVLGGG